MSTSSPPAKSRWSRLGTALSLKQVRKSQSRLSEFSIVDWAPTRGPEAFENLENPSVDLPRFSIGPPRSSSSESDGSSTTASSFGSLLEHPTLMVPGTFLMDLEEPPQPMVAVGSPMNQSPSATPSLNGSASGQGRVPSISDSYQQVGEIPDDEGDSTSSTAVSIPWIARTVNVRHLRRPLLPEVSVASILALSETVHLGSLENASHLQSLATPRPLVSEVVSMDCGVLPSQLYSQVGQRTIKHEVSHLPEPEEEKVTGWDGHKRLGVGWMVPSIVDSHQNNYAQDDHANSSHQQGSKESSDGVYNIPSSAKPPPPQDNRPFHAHGWIEYLLPDESLYYVHQGYQAVADMDLSNEGTLNTVMAYLEDHDDIIPPGKELWLRDARYHRSGFVPLRWLVDHTRQSVVFDSSHEDKANREDHLAHYGCMDDRLDTKYRYWSFMESHPAHTSLPPDAHQDAIGALNWASTDGLLLSHRSIPAPFTRKECQSLTTFLQSVDQQGETPLRTRTISKILLRIVCWRQSHFRPDKPLPVDADCEDPPPVCGGMYAFFVLKRRITTNPNPILDEEHRHPPIKTGTALI
ncbi:hypothetical protein BD779DRAFT_1470917 [Infundibulicybe gibba]|nr:hypothetical protein BD779DRAFT_1470917 [Infundibulicybe gibba]